jgi:aspartate/glutamate racemase
VVGCLDGLKKYESMSKTPEGQIGYTAAGPKVGSWMGYLINRNQKTNGDEGHIDVNSFSSSKIADRSRAYEEGCPELPAQQMFEIMRDHIFAPAAVSGAPLVAGVACNTFHVDPIFRPFLGLTEDYKKTTRSEIEIVHMAEAVARFVKMNFPHSKNIGLLSTTVTRDSGLYHSLLRKGDKRVVEVDPTYQQDVDKNIYRLKANPDDRKARRAFLGFANKLIEAGARVIILGCTEIAFAFRKEFRFDDVPSKPYGDASAYLIDTNMVLARELIRRTNRRKLKCVLGRTDC